MALYIVFVVIGDLGAYVIGLAAERIDPSISLVVFLACFFMVFWLAWQLAVRLTEPKAA